MKYNELGKFTHEELSHLTHAQLALDKLELLEQVSKDAEIPQNIRDKLYEICNEVMKASKVTSIDLPINKKKLSVNDALTIMKFITTLKDFSESVYPIIDKLYTHFFSN